MSEWFDLRPPRGGIGFLAGLMIVLSSAIIFGRVGGDRLGVIALAILVLGLGLWLKHSWARWVALSFFVLGAIASVLFMIDQGFSTRGLIKLLVALSTVHALWEWDVWPAPAYGQELANDNDFAEDWDPESDDAESDEHDPQGLEQDAPRHDLVSQRPSFWSTRP